MPAEPYNSEGGYYELEQPIDLMSLRQACRAILQLREALQAILDLPLGAFAADSKGIAQKALEWEQDVEPGGVTPY